MVSDANVISDACADVERFKGTLILTFSLREKERHTTPKLVRVDSSAMRSQGNCHKSYGFGLSKSTACNSQNTLPIKTCASIFRSSRSWSSESHALARRNFR